MDGEQTPKAIAKNSLAANGWKRATLRPPKRANLSPQAKIRGRAQCA